MTTTITLTEEERQATLMALAHLAVERPGWLIMLQEIAGKMDNATAEGPELFNNFWSLHQDSTRTSLPNPASDPNSTTKES